MGKVNLLDKGFCIHLKVDIKHTGQPRPYADHLYLAELEVGEDNTLTNRQIEHLCRSFLYLAKRKDEPHNILEPTYELKKEENKYIYKAIQPYCG